MVYGGCEGAAQYIVWLYAFRAGNLKHGTIRISKRQNQMALLSTRKNERPITLSNNLSPWPTSHRTSVPHAQSLSFISVGQNFRSGRKKLRGRLPTPTSSEEEKVRCDFFSFSLFVFMVDWLKNNCFWLWSVGNDLPFGLMLKKRPFSIEISTKNEKLSCLLYSESKV